MKSNNFSTQFVSKLLGKAEKSEKQEIVIPPIKELVEDLVSLGDDVWGQYAFRREPLKGKFTLEQRAKLIEKAHACGTAYAEKMRSEYGEVNMYTLAEKLGLEVDYPYRPNGGGHIIFAQFVVPNKVTIYKDSVNRANELIEEKQLSPLFEHIQLEELLLAHEIFHFIEENDGEIFTRTEMIRLWKIGPMKNDSQIVCLGEIAGMAFAKALLKISYSPYVLDPFLVYLYHPEVGYGLYQEVMKLK